MCLRYDRPLPHLPMECVCGTSFTVEHVFTCPHGGYPSLCLNEIRDTTSQLMSEVCPNVAAEPTLQPVTTKCFSIVLPILRVMLILMGGLRDFEGFTINKLILTSMCLTPWLCLIITHLSLLALDPMTMRNVEHEQRVHEVERLSLTTLYFQHLLV